MSGSADGPKDDCSCARSASPDRAFSPAGFVVTSAEDGGRHDFDRSQAHARTDASHDESRRAATRYGDGLDIGALERDLCSVKAGE